MKSLGRRQANLEIIKSYQKKKKKKEGRSFPRPATGDIYKFNPRTTVKLLYICYLVIDNNISICYKKTVLYQKLEILIQGKFQMKPNLTYSELQTDDRKNE